MGFRPGRKSRYFLMPYRNPGDRLIGANAIGNPVQRISGETKDAFYSCGYQRLD
jgi:hypothetical protein